MELVGRTAVWGLGLLLQCVDCGPALTLTRGVNYATCGFSEVTTIRWMPCHLSSPWRNAFTLSVPGCMTVCMLFSAADMWFHFSLHTRVSTGDIGSCNPLGRADRGQDGKTEVCRTCGFCCRWPRTHPRRRGILIAGSCRAYGSWAVCQCILPLLP